MKGCDFLEWLNTPQEPINPKDGYCIIRVCSNKKYCNPYTCAILICNTNKK